MRMMRASVVSSPTAIASTTRRPTPFSAPAVTRSPSRLTTGRLAGDERFVGLALAGDDRPVDGEALARLDDDAIACAHLLDPDLGFPAVALHDGALRPQAHERANGGGRAALGARLQPLAEHDRGDDGGGALEIKVPGGFGAPHEHHIGAEGISGRRAERDQQVHIAGIGAQRLPGALVEARSDDELHGRGERKLDPRVEMQMQAERRGDHRQEERGGERRRCDEQHELTPFRIRARGLTFLFLAAALGERGCPRVRSVTDPLDRLRELRWRHGGGTKHDVRAFECEVDACLPDARDLPQRRFDPCRAGGAGHTADVQHHMRGRRLRRLRVGLDLGGERHQHKPLIRANMAVGDRLHNIRVLCVRSARRAATCNETCEVA
jgi:hypothetical protein